MRTRHPPEKTPLSEFHCSHTQRIGARPSGQNKKWGKGWGNGKWAQQEVGEGVRELECAKQEAREGVGEWDWAIQEVGEGVEGWEWANKEVGVGE